MLVISECKLEEIKNTKYKVYSKEILSEGVECLCDISTFSNNERFYITSVSAKNIKHKDGKFYYTTEDLSSVADWFPAQIIPINGTFKKCKHKPVMKCVSLVGDDKGKCIKGNGCLVDTSCMPAFNGVNEDLTVNEYRFYLTLFNDYTVKQCQYERHNLHDATFKSSKYDLVSKMQNSDFLKSKDFKMINNKRQDDESVKIGLVIKEGNSKYDVDYGTVYINMDNKVSIKWH